MKTTNFLSLPDKRQLAYAEFGHPSGHPVLYFHGGVSCRLEPLLWGDETIRRLGLRLIAPDRPGIGQSDLQLNRGFSDWVKDIEFLADALGLDKFSILGVSGGGGYIVACAAKIPERIHAAVVVSGAWHVDAIEHFPRATRFAWMLMRRFPWLNVGLLKLQTKSFKESPEQLLAHFKKRLSAVDYAALKSLDRIQTLHQISTEAMLRGIKGVAWDVQLYLQEWDFGLDEIQMPFTFLHGEQDKTIPIEIAKRVVTTLPTAQLITYPEEGHLSLILNKFEAISKALIDK